VLGFPPRQANRHTLPAMGKTRAARVNVPPLDEQKAAPTARRLRSQRAPRTPVCSSQNRKHIAFPASRDKLVPGCLLKLCCAAGTRDWQLSSACQFFFGIAIPQFVPHDALNNTGIHQKVATNYKFKISTKP
jgi:hypothetical protein